MAKTAYSLGAELFIGILNSGGRTNPYYRCEGSDKIVSPGDMVISDICLNWMGYNTCTVRAFVEGGKPTDEQKALYTECYEALCMAMDVCKAGVTTDKVAAALPPQTWENWSLQICHGIGCQLHEKPHIVGKWPIEDPMKLEANVVLALETYAGEPIGSKTQGVRLEDVLIVTEDGYEVISRYPFWDEKMLS